MEGLLSFFFSSICFNIRTFTFLLLLPRVDISDFPRTQLAKLQCLLTKEDEQQPLPVHLRVKKCWQKKNQAVPLWIMAHISDDNFCKMQNPPGHNHDQLFPRWWHFCHLSTCIMGIFRFWRNGEFTFFQICLQPLYFTWSPPSLYPVKSSVLCWHQVLLRFYLHVQQSKKIQENRGLWTAKAGGPLDTKTHFTYTVPPISILQIN